MKKQLWLALAVFTAFALLFIACKDGGGGTGPVDMTDQWPNFTNAQKLEVDQFGSTNYPGLLMTQWKFYHPGGSENEDFGAPHNPKTFKNSKYLIIASVGGGKHNNSTTAPATMFDENGFDAVLFQVGAGNGANWSDYVKMVFQPRANEISYIIPFEHTAEEIVYFVYDLSVYIPSLTAINITNSEIVFKVEYEPAEKALGQYQAYITSANLTKGASDTEMKNDALASGVVGVANDVSLGWITQNPGLTPAQ